MNGEKERKGMSKDRVVKGKLVFVMGGGKFGTNAVRYLKSKGAKVLVVDINPNCPARSEADVLTTDLGVLDSLKERQATFIVGDAVDVLVTLLENKMLDMVVTAIPGNAIAKVVEACLMKRGIKLEPYSEIIPKVLENIPESLVSLVDHMFGIIVVSYMPSNIKCIENCTPPENVCALTGRPKIASMNKLLEFSVYSYTDFSWIFYSTQLTGGLGAINGNELNSLLKRLANIKRHCSLTIGTACDCHGIVRFVKTK